MLSKIFKYGYSRIPVFDKSRSDIVGLILAKDLIFIDPDVSLMGFSHVVSFFNTNISLDVN